MAKRNNNTKTSSSSSSPIQKKKNKTKKKSKRASSITKQAKNYFVTVNSQNKSSSSSHPKESVTHSPQPSDTTFKTVESPLSISRTIDQQQIINKLTPETFPVFEQQLRNENQEFLDSIFGPDTDEVLEAFIEETRDYVYRRESSKVSLGFIGNTGVGKSTFINTLLVLSCIPDDHYPQTIERLSGDKTKDYEVFKDTSLLNEIESNASQTSSNDETNSNSTRDYTEFNLLPSDHPHVEDISEDAEHPNDTTLEKSYLPLFQNYHKDPPKFREKITEQKGFVLPQAETGETESITNTMVVVKYGTVPHICVKYETKESILDSLKSLLSSIVLDKEDFMKVEKYKRYIMGITGWNEAQLNTCIKNYENSLPASLNENSPEIDTDIFNIRESIQHFIDKQCDVFLTKSGNLAQDISSVRNKLEELTKNPENDDNDSNEGDEDEEDDEEMEKREEINQRAAVIEKIVVYLPCKILQNNVELIDIPGSNDSDPVKSIQLSKAISDRTYLVLLTNKNFSACEQERKMLQDSGFLDRLLPNNNNNNNNNNNENTSSKESSEKDDDDDNDDDKVHLFVFSNMEVNNAISLQHAKKKVNAKKLERNGVEDMVNFLKNYKGSESDLSDETIRSVVQKQVTFSKICPVLMASLLMSDEFSDTSLVEKLKFTGGYDFLCQLNRLVLNQYREAKKQFSGAKFTIKHIESNLSKYLDGSQISKQILKTSEINCRKKRSVKGIREKNLENFHRDEWNPLKNDMRQFLIDKIESFYPCFENNAHKKTKNFRTKLMNSKVEEKRRLLTVTKSQVTVSKIRGMKSLYWYFCSGIASDVDSQAKQINIEIRRFCKTFVYQHFRPCLFSLIETFYPNENDAKPFIDSAREYLESNALPRIEEEIRKSLCHQFGHFAIGHTLFRDKCATSLVEVIKDEKHKLMERELSVEDLKPIMSKVAKESWRLMSNALESRMKMGIDTVSKKLFGGSKTSYPSLLNSILHRFFKLLSDSDVLKEENWLNRCLKEIMKTDYSSKQEKPEQVVELLNNFVFYRSRNNSSGSGLTSPTTSGKKRKRTDSSSSSKSSPQVKQEPPNKKRRVTRSSKS